MTANRKARLVLLSLVALTLFNFPLIGIVSDNSAQGNLPQLYYYIFTVWALLILVIYLLTNRKDG